MKATNVINTKFMEIRNVLFIAIALMAITNMSSAAVNISTDGLLAAYDCKEGVDPSILYDVSGNGHDGTLLGTTNWTTEGLSFDGISGYADIGDIGNLKNGYTIIAVYNTADTNYQSILSRTTASSASTGGHGFTMRTQHMMQFNDATECVYGAYQPLIDPTKYTYTSVRFDGSTIASRSPSSISNVTCAGFNETSGNYKIGRLSHYAGWYFNGTLAYLAIYDRSMSDSELSETYNILKSEVDDRSINLPPLRDAQIVISHDDGLSTDYTTAYKISSVYGIPTTSYLNMQRIGQSNILSLDQIRSLKYAGYDIEGHLYSHISAVTMTDEQLNTSYQNNNNAFILAGLPTPEHMSYPFGAYNANVITLTGAYRSTGRGVSTGTSVLCDWYPPDSWYSLKAPGIYRAPGNNITDIKSAIDDAISKNYTLIYHMHDVSLSPSASGCYTPLYEELMEYINSSGIEAVTIDTLYRESLGIRTYPPIEVDTENFIILGETTDATYDSNVSEVGFVWGTTNLNNPGNLAPDESNYSYSYISDPGNYKQSEFNYTIELTNTTAPYYFYRAGAKVDDVWVYGSEITIANIQPVAGFVSDVTSGNYPLAVNFSETLSEPLTPSNRSWDFGDGTNSTEMNPTHIYSAPGVYTVNLTLDNAIGSDSEIKTGYITARGADFSSNVISGTAPLSIRYTDSSVPNATAWYWDFENDGIIDSIKQNPAHTYGKSGNYTVNLTVQNEYGTFSTVKTNYITIYPPSWVIAHGGVIDVEVIAYTTNHAVWIESSDTPAAYSEHIMPGFTANVDIEIYMDGVLYDRVTSNSTGVITWVYDGGFSEHEFGAYVVSDFEGASEEGADMWSTGIAMLEVTLLIIAIGLIIGGLRGQISMEVAISFSLGLMAVMIIVYMGAGVGSMLDDVF